MAFNMDFNIKMKPHPKNGLEVRDSTSCYIQSPKIKKETQFFCCCSSPIRCSTINKHTYAASASARRARASKSQISVSWAPMASWGN
jgi:hypothetical protein